MIISKQTLAIGVGAITGGFLTDDSGLMTAVGATVGAGIGATWDFVEPETMGKIKKYNTELNLNNIVIPDRQKEDLERFEKMVSTGKYSNRIKKVQVGQIVKPIDFDDLENTLNEVTLRDIMATGTPEQKLKIKEYLRNPDGYTILEDLSDVVLKEVTRQENRVVYGSIVGEQDIDLLRQDRLTAVENFFREKGYEGDELDNKVKLATANIQDHDVISINKTKNTLKIGDDPEIKVIDKIDETLIHFDGNNAYGTRRLNLFGQYIAKHSDVADKNAFFSSEAFTKHVDNILDSLQIDNEEVRNVFKANAKQWMTTGMSADELRMFANHSPILKNNPTIDNIIDGAMQWLQEDTGEYRRGVLQLDDLTNHAKTVSNVTQAKETLRINKQGIIQGTDPGDTVGVFKGLDTHVGDDGNSDLTRMLRFVNESLGINNVKTQTSINHPTSYNSSNVFSLATSEYSDKTRISPYRPVKRRVNERAKLNSVDTDVRTTLRVLEGLNLLPEEMQTEAMTKVLSVDQNKANDVLRLKDISTQFGDGFGIGTLSFSTAFTQKQYGSVELKGLDNEVALSNSLLNILRGRDVYGVDKDSVKLDKIKLKGYDSHLFEEYINTNRSLWGTDKKGRKDLFKKFANMDYYNENAFNDALKESLEKKKAFRIAKAQKAGKVYNSDKIDNQINSIASGQYYKDFLEAIKQSPGYKARVQVLDQVKKQILSVPEFNDAYQTIVDRIEEFEKDPLKLKRKDFQEINDFIGQRNSAITGRIKGVIGVQQIKDGFGNVESVPKILTGNVRLRDLKVLETLEGLKEIKIDLDSETIQIEGETYKYYGPGSKINQKAFNQKDFDEIANALLSDSQTRLRSMSQNIDFSVIAESGSTGQKEAMKLHDLLSNPNYSNSEIRYAAELTYEQGLQLADGSKEKEIWKALQDTKLSDGLKRDMVDLMETYRPETLNYTADPDQAIMSNKRSWALTQLLNAVSEGKATDNAVKGLLFGGVTNVNKVLRSVEQSGDINELLNIPGISRDLQDLIKNNSDVFTNRSAHVGTDLQRDLTNRIAEEVSIHFREEYDKFRPGQLTRNILQGDILNRRMLDNFAFAYDEVGTSWFFGTKEREANAFTGAGGTQKKLSHFFIQAAVDKGFTPEMFEWFSSVDTKVAYDNASFHAAYQDPKGVTLDKFLMRMVENDSMPSDKMKEIVDELIGKGANPSDIRGKLESRVRSLVDDSHRLEMESMLKDLFENSDGTKKPFLYFALPDQKTLGDTTGVKQIPLYLGNTDMGGQTIAQNGMIINSKLSNAHGRVIHAAIDHMTEGAQLDDITVSGITTLGTRSRLIEATTDVANFYRDYMTSSNNAMAKNVFSRIGDNSAFLKVVAGAGQGFEDEVENAVKEGRSVVGVSRKRAESMLREMGVNITDTDALDDFLDDDGYITRTAGSKKRMYFLNSREPTITASGVRLVNVKVMENIKDEEIAIGANDLIYTRLMTGDMDNDNVYLIGMKKMLSNDEYKLLENLASSTAEVDKELVDIAKYMGVKAKGVDVKYDYTKLLEEIKNDPGRFGLTAEDLNAIKVNRIDMTHSSSDKVLDAMQAALESRDQASSLKAGQRKIVTPTVTTMVKTILDNPVFHTETDALTKGTAMLVGNFLVENLLKSSHTETGKKNPLDELLDSFKDFAKHHKDEAKRDIFIERLENQLKDMENSLTKESSFITNPLKNKISAGFTHVINTAKRMDVTQSVNVLAINQQANTLQMKAMVTGGTPSVNIAKLGSTMQKYNPSRVSNGSLNGLTWTPTNKINKTQTTQAGYNLIKNTIMDNIKANTLPLAIGAGVIGLTALITQKGPDFDHSNGKVSSGEASAMTLTPHTLQDETSMLDMLGGEKSTYITPPIDTAKFKQQAIQMYGGYEDITQRSSDNLNKAIFGNNISAVRMDTTYGYNN